MKKKLIITILLTGIFSLSANAAGMVFDPTEYEIPEIPSGGKTKQTIGASSSTTSAASKTTPAKTTSGDFTPKSTAPNKTFASTSSASDKSGAASSSKPASAYSYNTGESLDNILFELDNSQVNLRNELLDQQEKYREIDTQYQLIKKQRKELADQIKAHERKINNIENSKKHIRKSMI